MPITVSLPKNLNRARFRAPSAEIGATIRVGDPIASFVRKGKVEVMRSDAAGVLLRVLVSEELECVAGEPIALLGGAKEEIGYDPEQVECVRLELLNKCSKCKTDYPLNGLIEEARCTRCGGVQLLDDEFWREEIAQDVTFARVPGARGGGEVLGGPTIECRGVPPFCRKCNSLIPMDTLTSAWTEAREVGSAKVDCASCGTAHSARHPPAWGREVFEGLSFLFGETATEPSRGAAKPVVFKCPTCSASLEIGGEKRVVRCRYCESDVYLPDDLWTHFNPTAQMSPWWMLLEPQKKR